MSVFKNTRGHNISIQFTDSGFILCEPYFWGLKNKLTEVRWSSVLSINVFVWDCYIESPFGFRLILPEDKSICIDEDNLNWKEFHKKLFEEFSDIDKTIVEKVSTGFPDDQELRCWDRLA
jgi:hypothetical protein